MINYKTFYYRSGLDIYLNGIREMINTGELMVDKSCLPPGAIMQSDGWHYIYNGSLKSLPILNPKI